jgi:hypothetical protein
VQLALASLQKPAKLACSMELLSPAAPSYQRITQKWLGNQKILAYFSFGLAPLCPPNVESSPSFTCHTQPPFILKADCLLAYLTVKLCRRKPCSEDRLEPALRSPSRCNAAPPAKGPATNSAYHSPDH